MNTTMTPDYVGVLRHTCPACGKPAAIRELNQGAVRTLYCEHQECGFEEQVVRKHLLPTSRYVCGATDPHEEGEHRFITNAAARQWFDDQVYPTAATWADGVFAEERPFPEVSS